MRKVFVVIMSKLKGELFRALAEQILLEYIIPLPSPSAPSSKGGEIDEVAWTDRLLHTMKHIEEKSIRAMSTLTGLKAM